MDYNIKGYKYQTEQEALNAIELCNKHYGIPVSPESTTTTWTTHNFSYGNPDFYFIMFDDSLSIVLGEPIDLLVSSTALSGSTMN